jgi:hypothetical protein
MTDRTPNTELPDAAAGLLDIEAGIYAVAAIAGGDWPNPIAADRARNGIQYLSGKLEHDVRGLYRQLTDAGQAPAAGGGERVPARFARPGRLACRWRLRHRRHRRNCGGRASYRRRERRGRERFHSGQLGRTPRAGHFVAVSVGKGLSRPPGQHRQGPAIAHAAKELQRLLHERGRRNGALPGNQGRAPVDRERVS